MHSEQTKGVVDYYHGIPVADPCRWLEDGTSPEVREWTNRQREAFRAHIDPLPDRNSIRARVRQMLSVTSVDSPWQVGSRLFYMKRTSHQEQPCLMMHENDHEVTLIDPNDDPTHKLTLQLLQVSPDGTLLALGEKVGGEDTCSIKFFDTSTGSIMPTTIGRGFHRGITFGADRRTAYHAHERVDSNRQYYRAVYRLDLISGEESEVFFAGHGRRRRVRVIAGAPAEWMLYLVREPERQTEFYLHNAMTRATPRLLDISSFKEFGILLVGPRCLALVRRISGERQIVSFDADHPEPATGEIILQKLPDELTDFTVWGDFICASESTANKSLTTVYDLQGRQIDEIHYPPDATLVTYPRLSPAQTGIYYKYSSFAHPAILNFYDLHSKNHITIFSESPPFLPARVETLKDSFTSEDGTTVPIVVAWDPEHVLPGPAPMIFTAYGGFGTIIRPAYSNFITFLLQQGLRFAFANVRGGSELGYGWYEAGARRNKPNTIADFISGAEWLISRGFTTSSQLGVFGGSNSGLIVAAAMMQRPTLFGVVVCAGALLDMLRYHNFDLTYRWIPEYGSSDDPLDLPILLSYSPYHNIRTDVSYPPILLISGEADNRCNPLHVRKMAERLQKEARCNPILVDISPIRGHSQTMPLNTRIDSLSDVLAFICNELGVRVHEDGVAAQVRMTHQGDVHPAENSI